MSKRGLRRGLAHALDRAHAVTMIVRVTARRCVLALSRLLGTRKWHEKVSHFLQAISVGPLHWIIVRPWGSFLQIAGYRFLRVEWYEWAAGRFGKTSYLLALLDAKNRIGENLVSEITPNDILSFTPDATNLLRKLKLMHKADLFLRNSDQHYFSFGSDEFFSRRFHTKLWDAHNAGDQAAVRRFAQAYTETLAGDPTSLVHIVSTILIPSGHFDIAAYAIEKAAGQLRSKGPIPRALELELKVLRMQALEIPDRGGDLHLPRPEKINSDNVDTYYIGAIIEGSRNNINEYGRYLRIYIEKAGQFGGAYIEDALYLIACYHEEMREFELADLYYQRAVIVGKVPYYLPNPVWRYVSFLMGLNRWEEAALLLIEGQKELWRHYASLSCKPFRQRISKHSLIPPKGMFILGCQGISDDMIRLGILYRSAGSLANFGMTCDPRMLAIHQRSFPEMEFVAPSRQSGPFGVDVRTYWEDREGVPADLDIVRVTRSVLEKAATYPDIGLSEDLLLDFVMSKGQLPIARTEPMFKVDPTLLEGAKAWMATLPGRLKVAISWRSGIRDRSRSESYVDALALGPILRLQDVDFISLQYSDTREEEAEMLEHFGCRLHKMPGVDLKNDIDNLAAISLGADFVIAPGTAARELAGAVGARTLSLTTTPVLPDLWRVAEDGETDKIFPSITHVTVYRHQTKAAVIEEIARRLAEARDPL